MMAPDRVLLHNLLLLTWMAQLWMPGMRWWMCLERRDRSSRALCHRDRRVSLREGRTHEVSSTNTRLSSTDTSVSTFSATSAESIARDSSSSVATLQDLYIALCEDEGVWGMFQRMEGGCRVTQEWA